MAGDPLLEPFEIKHLTLRNRVFSSAHEPAYSEDGMPKDRYRLYHEEKAKGGIALTMTAGSAVVSRDSPPSFGNLLAYKDEIVPWIKRMTDGVHEHGSACMIQLSHLGRRTTWNQSDWLPVVAPSAIREPAHRSIPKEAEDWDIERIIEDYASAAARMEAGGMDGIEIESYGHLFDAWWSPQMNFRDDEWSATEPNRFRFATQVLEAMRAATSETFLVGLRLAVDQSVPGGIDEPAGLVILDHFEQAGLIDFVNVIRGSVETDVLLSDVIPIHGMAAAPHLEFVGRVREATELPVLHASKIDDVASARFAIESGKLDMVGMTRAHMADPHIVNKIAEGREAQIRPCVGATYCLDRIYEAGEALCLHNAATSREAEIPHHVPRAPKAKKVVIVGAGPAGLEAARVAGERGHDVTVFEALPVAGGQVQLAARNPRRVDLLGIVDWRLSELDRLGVTIEYNTIVDGDDVLDRAADVVIVATGGSAQLPSIDDPESRMVTGWEVLGGDVKPEGDVLFFDDYGNHSALSAAELIARSGANLEIVTPERMLGIDIGGMNHVPYARAFNETDTRITLNQHVRSVLPEAGRLCVELGSDHSDHRAVRHVDWVVADHGTIPNSELYFELKPSSTNLGAVDYGALIGGEPQRVVRNPEGSFSLFRLGDAVSSRNIHAAIYDAVRLMKDI